MTARSLRNIETRKKKAQRKAPSAGKTRNSGNTGGVRQQLKKRANIARAKAQ